MTNEDFVALHTAEFMDAARHIYAGFGLKILKELDLHFGRKYWLYLVEIERGVRVS